MASKSSRKMIAALQVSLDGFIQGPDGEKDWADSWASALQLIPDVDMFVLGGRMYPDYGAYLGIDRGQSRPCPAVPGASPDEE